MQWHKLILESAQDGTFHTFFRNNHSRWLYMNMALDGELVHITDCFYIDRPKIQKRCAIPKKLKTRHCNLNALLEVCANELDKRFFGIEIKDKTDRLTKEAYIQSVISDSGKFKPLILVGKVEGDELPERLETRIKNRIHRSIYLDLRRKDRDSGVIHDCHYFDVVYKRTGALITPAGLTTVFFRYDTETILKIVNNELNCNFTDVVIARDSFGFDRGEKPICGYI